MLSICVCGLSGPPFIDKCLVCPGQLWCLSAVWVGCFDRTHTGTLGCMGCLQLGSPAQGAGSSAGCPGDAEHIGVSSGEMQWGFWGELKLWKEKNLSKKVFREKGEILWLLRSGFLMKQSCVDTC